MKTKTTELADELRSEYDFTSMKGGVRGKYAKRCQGNTDGVGVVRAQVPLRKPRAAKPS